ncbi:MAG TPA: glycosyltransferase family 87 protein [Pirellulales bacterium]|nr:glycosyltransferase family 87 protein [Pirellulales bacterium]
MKDDEVGWRRLRSTLLHPWVTWTVLTAAIATFVAVWPEGHTVTPNYRDACFRWFAGEDIYGDGPHGFLYFPHAAILFAPFAYLPFGDVLWRVVGIGGLALAVQRFTKIAPPADRGMAFRWMTVAAIPPALASARNGQMNLVLAGFMALAVASLAERRWKWAAFWLSLGLAMKPLMAIPIAAAVVGYRPVFKPLAAGLLLVVAAPFATQAPAFVAWQHVRCYEKLLLAANPGSGNPASDLFGLLSFAGFDASAVAQTAIRAAAGIALLILCYVAVRRKPRRTASALVLTFLACYLTLFNPRAENNGYVVLAPALAAWAAWSYRGRRPLVRWAAVLVAFAIAGSYELTRGHNFWLNPLLASMLLSFAVARVFSRSTQGSAWGGLPRPSLAGTRGKIA